MGAKTLLTVEQFATLPDDDHATQHELDAGELITMSLPKSPTPRSPTGFTKRWMQRSKVGPAASISKLVTCLPRHPSQSGRIVRRVERQDESGYFAGAADIAVEVISPSNMELAKEATNAQLWWAILAGLPVCWWLRRFTRAPGFSLMFAAMAALLCLATLLRMGMLDWLDHDPGHLYFDLIPCALLFMAAGFLFEHLHQPDDSRYFYPFAVAFTWAALTGVATFHEPWAKWLQSAAPWTRGQIEYLFILNAAVYFVLDRVCDRFSSPQVRMVGKSFRLVIPGHVMTSVLLLGMDAKSHVEARVLEWTLPAVACVFVFASIPRQMKTSSPVGWCSSRSEFTGCSRTSFPDGRSGRFCC